MEAIGVKFFKDLTRARDFQKKVNGELYKKGSKEFNKRLFGLLYKNDYKEFDYVVSWID